MDLCTVTLKGAENAPRAAAVSWTTAEIRRPSSAFGAPGERSLDLHKMVKAVFCFFPRTSFRKQQKQKGKKMEGKNSPTTSLITLSAVGKLAEAVVVWDVVRALHVFPLLGRKTTQNFPKAPGGPIPTQPSGSIATLSSAWAQR